MQEKNVGYGLLAVGIAIMAISAIIVLLVFTGAMKPVQVFDIQAPTINTRDLLPQVPGLTGEGSEIEIVPTSAFNTSLNLAVQFFLMSFLMTLGFKLADLGTKLIRPIKVEGKNEKV